MLCCVMLCYVMLCYEAKYLGVTIQRNLNWRMEATCKQHLQEG